MAEREQAKDTTPEGGSGWGGAPESEPGVNATLDPTLLATLKAKLAYGAVPGVVRAFLDQVRATNELQWSDLVVWMQKNLGNHYTHTVLEAAPVTEHVATDGEIAGRADGHYDFYADAIRKAGGTVASGKVTVLGVRCQEGVGPHFLDYFYVLRPDRTVVAFRGSTTPSIKGGTIPAGANPAEFAPDVASADGSATKDGKSDVGMIRPGNFKIRPHRLFDGKTSFYVAGSRGENSVPGWRDTNQDGSFDDEEKAASERRGDKLGGVLIHVGKNSDYRVAAQSANSMGCLTIAPSEIDFFIQCVGGASASFDYTLVTHGTIGALPDVELPALAPSMKYGETAYKWYRTQ